MDVLDKMTIDEYNTFFPKANLKKVQIGQSETSAFEMTEYGLYLHLKTYCKEEKAAKQALKMKKLDEWESKILGRCPVVRVMHEKNEKEGDDDGEPALKKMKLED